MVIPKSFNLERIGTGYSSKERAEHVANRLREWIKDRKETFKIEVSDMFAPSKHWDIYTDAFDKDFDKIQDDWWKYSCGYDDRDEEIDKESNQTLVY